MLSYGIIKGDGSISVKLEGRHVGQIEPHGEGYWYRPDGQKEGGEVFKTTAAVKRSLESEEA